MTAPGIEFGDFVRARSRDLLRLGWLLTSDWSLAEDLVQTALTGCWQRWDSVTTPEPYVRTAILRTHLSWRRRRSAGEVVSADLDSAARDELCAVDVRASIGTALARLSARERAVGVLRYYVDLSERETATTLGISVGSVKRYAANALGKLRNAPTLTGLLTEEQPR